MKTTNTQTTTKEHVTKIPMFLQSNQQIAGTCFFSMGSSISSYDFKKLVSSLRNKAMKR